MSFVSLDRIRARHAHAAVKSVGAAVGPKYRSVVRNLPSMLQSAGVAQYFAFLRVKDSPEHKTVLFHLSQWLAEAPTVPWSPETSGSETFERLLDEETEVWWLADKEAMAYGVWLKRFAEARFPNQRAKGDNEATATKPSISHSEAGPE